MKFSEITNAEQLLQFLNTRNHLFYHHFTTLNALREILRHQTWRLSSACGMNDLHEYTRKGDREEWRRMLSASFSFGDEDNIAMWALYAIPWEKGVRITIPRFAMREWIRSLNRFLPGENLPPAESIVLHDVVYYNDSAGGRTPYLSWARGRCPVLSDGGWSVTQSGRFTGYIKNAAWKQESESRLTIKFQSDYPDSFFDVPLPEVVLRSMKITFAPWFAGDGENALQTILKAADGIPDEIQSRIRKNAGHCAFQSCLHLRRHCDLCTHAFQEKEAGGHGEG